MYKPPPPTSFDATQEGADGLEVDFYDCTFTEESLGLELKEDYDSDALVVVGCFGGENSEVVRVGDIIETLNGVSLVDDLQITTVARFEDYVSRNPARPLAVKFRRETRNVQAAPSLVSKAPLQVPRGGSHGNILASTGLPIKMWGIQCTSRIRRFRKVQRRGWCNAHRHTP